MYLLIRLHKNVIIFRYHKTRKLRIFEQKRALMLRYKLDIFKILFYSLQSVRYNIVETCQFTAPFVHNEKVFYHELSLLSYVV